jgi:hypothetical protein
MPKHWDASMLLLLRASPDAFINLFVPTVCYIGERPQKRLNHQRDVDGLLKSRQAMANGC